MARKPVFQDVTADTPRVAPVAGGLIESGPKGARGPIRAWLWLIFALVTAMFLIGDAARLVGLDMPTAGASLQLSLTPPATPDAWASAADAYAGQPSVPAAAAPETALPSASDAAQAKAVAEPVLGGPAATPDVAAFKQFYLLNWGHRALGMAVLAIWALGYLAFAATGRVPTGWSPRLLAVGGLIAAQAVIGMIPTAAAWGAPVKTAAHVGLGFALIGQLTGAILLLSRSEAALLRARRAGEAKLFGMTTGLLHLTVCQAIVGGLVAAIGAGRQYTGWPKMGGEWVPSTIWDAALGVQNLILNPALVQFIHRGLGYLVAIFAIIVWLRARRSPHPVTRGAYTVMLAATAFLAVLGIVNVMHASPLPEALSHQFMAIAAFALMVRARQHARMPHETTIRGTIR